LFYENGKWLQKCACNLSSLNQRLQRLKEKKLLKYLKTVVSKKVAEISLNQRLKAKKVADKFENGCKQKLLKNLKISR